MHVDCLLLPPLLQVYVAFILSLQPVSLQRLLSVSQMFSPVWHVGFLWATPPTHPPLYLGLLVGISLEYPYPPKFEASVA
jgi:hypothetical protein